MADLDLEGLSLKDLKQLQKDIVKAIASFEERSKAEARLKVEAFARELGYPLSELVNGSAKTARQSAPPKYRHPENATLTWTGRGRKPSWFIEALESGKAPADLEIF